MILNFDLWTYDTGTTPAAQTMIVDQLKKSAEEFEYAIGRPGGIRTLATVSEPLTLNLAIANDASSSGVLGYLFEGLTETSWLTDQVEPALGFLLEKFLDKSINLSPRPVLNGDGSVRLEGLDNHGIGTVFEELIRRFNEENNEEAGEHFTPRDVVQLMARLVFLPVADAVRSGTYLVYDGACGTGGMLTVAEETLTQLASEQDKEVSIHLYGQEVNPEAYAISKADLILKGEGGEADNMQFGSSFRERGTTRSVASSCPAPPRTSRHHRIPG